MRNLYHLAARLFNAPLMVLPETADTFASVLGLAMGERFQEADGVALPRPLGYVSSVAVPERFAQKRYAVNEAGVAVLPVHGALVQRAGQMTGDCMPLASYQRLQSTMGEMMSDRDVKAIMMEIDSPGGEVAGNFEFVKKMLANRGGDKPIWAHVNEGGYSAAYSIAAAADRILVPQSGSVGSIGVVMMHMDQSVKDIKQGITYTPIFAGARKLDFSRHAPLSAEALKVGQSSVGRMYDIFVGHVAQARGLDAQAVRDTEAGIFAANDARSMGLIDDVASFDDAMAALTDVVRRPSLIRTTPRVGAQVSQPGGPAAHNSPKGGQVMPPENQAANDRQDETFTAAEHAQGIATARAEGVAAGQAAGATAGAAAERTRINTILRSDAAQGRTGLSMTLAFDTDMTAEQAQVVLAAAAKDVAPAAAVSPLSAAMAGVPNPKVQIQADSESPVLDARAEGRAIAERFNNLQLVK